MATIDKVGRSGLGVFSGVILDEFLSELSGQKGFKKYNEMWRNSPTIGAALAALSRSVLSTVEWGWSSDLGDDDPRIEFLQRAETNMKPSWKKHVAEAIEPTLVFGYTPFAVWLEKKNGEILWRKLLMLGQDTIWQWLFDEDGEISGLVQRVSGYPAETIPIERIVLYRTSVYRGNPEGRSVLRNSYIPYYFATNMQQIEGIGVERDIAGTPKVKLPANADTTSGSDDMNRAESIVRNLRNDSQAGVVEPNDYEVTLMSSGGSRLFDTDKIITRYKIDMLMSMGAQFMMLGQNGVGSLALSRDQTDFFVMFANNIAEMVAENFTEYAAKPLLKLNGYETEGIQRTHTPAGDIDLEKFASFLSSVGDKLTWRNQDEVWLRQMSQLPDATEEELKAEQDAKPAPVAPPANITPSVQQMQTDFYRALTKFNAALKK